MRLIPILSSHFHEDSRQADFHPNTHRVKKCEESWLICPVQILTVMKHYSQNLSNHDRRTEWQKGQPGLKWATNTHSIYVQSGKSQPQNVQYGSQYNNSVWYIIHFSLTELEEYDRNTKQRQYVVGCWLGKCGGVAASTGPQMCVNEKQIAVKIF